MLHSQLVSYLFLFVLRQKVLHCITKNRYIASAVLNDGVTKVRVEVLHMVKVDGKCYLLSMCQLGLQQKVNLIFFFLMQ